MNTCYLNFNSNVQYLFPQNTDMLAHLNRYFENPTIFYQCYNSNIIDFNQLIHLRQSNRNNNKVLTLSLKQMGIALVGRKLIYIFKRNVSKG